MLVSLLCLILELGSGDLFILSFSVGALCAAAATGLGAGVVLQIIIFVVCSLLSVTSPHGIIPINAITPIIGVPIIIYIIINRRRINYFN